MNVLGKVKCYIETNDYKNLEENNNCFQKIKVVSCRKLINIVIIGPMNANYWKFLFKKAQ